MELDRDLAFVRLFNTERQAFASARRNMSVSGIQQKRHAQISTTINIYGNALMESKREANTAVVRKILGNSER